MSERDDESPRLPWWRVPTMWLVIGGPLAVVVAGVATIAIAASDRDEPVARPAADATASAPALQARNHAATPAR